MARKVKLSKKTNLQKKKAKKQGKNTLNDMIPVLVVLAVVILAIGVFMILTPPEAVCGDGVCYEGEDCIEDCYVGPVCGDGVCMLGETCEACPQDCGLCPVSEPEGYCGDDICDADENCSTCAIDCGLCIIPEENATEEDEIVLPQGVTCGRDCLAFLQITPKSYGEDLHNLNGEYVIIKNNCNYSCDLTNWEVQGTNDKYVFPPFVLMGKAIVTLRSGKGIDTQQALYWDSRIINWQGVWDNNRGTAYLKDPDGQVIVMRMYDLLGGI
jgi:hypothetical protein